MLWKTYRSYAADVFALAERTLDTIAQLRVSQ
jgi:hypothetical protein